jgi:PPOX class probable F420-dependent enzyme
MTVLDEQARSFLEAHPSAAMITLRDDGSPHAVRVGIAVVDGKIWSSGTETRKRTANLRRDPRSTLFVFDTEWRWLTLECRVRLIEGPDAHRKSLQLFRTMQSRLPQPPPPGMILWHGAPKSEDEFLTLMADERRLIYEFEADKVYGMYGEPPR